MTMKRIISWIVLSFALTFVSADLSDDIDCVNTRNDALNGMSSQQQFDLMQDNLVVGGDLTGRRKQLAANSNLTCYVKFYDDYIPGLAAILQDGIQERLDKAETAEKRDEAIKMLASITQVMRCDEDWRALHFNETIESAQCSGIQSYTSQDSLRFKPKLALLESGLWAGKLGLKFKNTVVSGVVADISALYNRVYHNAEDCAAHIKDPEQSCRNIKMMAMEIERLFDLLKIQILAKL